MLHILLLILKILKIIGIILLCVLGILLLGVVCVLFVPVRYRVEAQRQEGEGNPPVVVLVKVTWLLHLINLLVRFDGALFLRARLAVIPVFRLPKKEKRVGEAGAVETAKPDGKSKKGRKKKDVPEPEGPEGEAEPEGEAVPEGETISGERIVPEGGNVPEGKVISGEKAAENLQIGESIENRQTAEEVSAESREAGAAGTENKEPEPDGTDEISSDKPSFFDKLRAFFQKLRGLFEKIKGFFANIQYTIQNFCDRISSVSDKVAYYREILEGEPFRRSFALCKKELFTVLKSLKPDTFEVQMVVGLDDPAATGNVLAVCGMLYPILGGHVDVAGDFEEKRLEGRVFIKGKVRFFTFLRAAVKLYFNKDIRKLVRLLKKEAV